MMFWTSFSQTCFIRCSFDTIIKIAFFLELVFAELPPSAEDEIIAIEHLPNRCMHLQDFFWTGIEDAPTWLDVNQLLRLYQIHSMHGTTKINVPDNSIQRQNSNKNTRQFVDCINCIEPTSTLIGIVDENFEILLIKDPGPRYWLLTVLKAGESVPSKVEFRLARLYRAAFTRQQQRHLGLFPDMPVHKNFLKQEIVIQNKTFNYMQTGKFTTESVPLVQSNRSLLLHMRPMHISKIRRALMLGLKNDFKRFKSISEVDVGLVQVRMHNISLTEDSTTKLIYTVHLGDKPVPAETAAKDMTLLSAQEVMFELGVSALILSEPFLKESRPLALSRKREVWLLIGASSVGLLLLLIIMSLFFAMKRKRTRNSIVVPPNCKILIKDEESTSTTADINNIACTSENKPEAVVMSEESCRTLDSLSICPASQEILEADTHNFISEIRTDDELKSVKKNVKSWNICDYAEISRPGIVIWKVQKTNSIHQPQSSKFINSAKVRSENFDILEDSSISENEKDAITGSPHSYLSMPSCKQFPTLKNIEPLSKVLESTFNKEDGKCSNHVSRSLSSTKDPGVLGPIVWDLKRKIIMEGRACSRLNKLLEDSFNLFGDQEMRDQPMRERQQQFNDLHSPETNSVDCDKSTQFGNVIIPTLQDIARPRILRSERIPQIKCTNPYPQRIWGSRPLSAGPFHRPIIPEIEVMRILTDSQLQSKDSTVPLIVAIKKELEKFTFE